MTTPTSAPTPRHDDDFGAGILDAPAPKPIAPKAAEPARAPSPPPLPAAAPPKHEDEDDGFGAGLL